MSISSLQLAKLIWLGLGEAHLTTAAPAKYCAAFYITFSKNGI